MLTDILFVDSFYVLILAVVMIVAGYVSHYNLLGSFYRFLYETFGDKKVLLVLLSAIGGILPIKGRIVVSAGMFDTLLKKDASSSFRKKFGVLNYIATHHYYMWSPLEKSILIPMAVLNITWTQMMGYTWPLLLVCVMALLVYVVWGVGRIGENEFILSENKQTEVQFIWPHRFLKWKTLALVYLVILVGNFVKIYAHSIEGFIGAHSGSLIAVSIVSFLSSLFLGSSGKFAGIVAILCGIYGVSYLTYFMAIEFAGYLLSPVHKCNMISMRYFKTSPYYYFGVISVLAVAIILCGVATII